jgi:hypothetical protein
MRSLSQYNLRLLLFSLSVVLVLALLPYFPVFNVCPVSADAEGWNREGQPVITKDKDQDNPPCYINRKVTVSDGSGSGTVTHSTACFEKSLTYNSNVKWTSPPAYLQPGSQVTFSMSANSNGGTISMAGGGIKINNSTLLEVHDIRQPSNTAAYKVPAGSPGLKLEIYVSYIACGLHGYVTYNYVYKGTGTTTSAIPSNIQSTSPVVRSDTVDIGTPRVNNPPPPKSVATFSNISGEVEIERPGEGRSFAKLNSTLPEGTKIITGENSLCIITFSDSSTLMMKSESEIIIAEANPEPTRLDILAGKLKMNVKKIMSGETMEVKSNLAILGIKGTELVCEETGSKSTIKVIEGLVQVTSIAKGNTIDLGAGSMVTATQSGLGSISHFDVKQEKATWDELTSTSSSTSTSGKKVKIGPLSCFIATAAYGSETMQELDTLRAFRDKVLLKNEPGRWFVDTYYTVSPPLAEYIAEHEDVRTFVREALLNPIVIILDKSQEQWNN